MSITKIRPKVYTVTEVAQLLAISPRLVRNLIHRGELPALRIGRSYRIPRKAADYFLAQAPPSTSRPTRKPRVYIPDEQTGFLFPVGMMQ